MTKNTLSACQPEEVSFRAGAVRLAVEDLGKERRERTNATT
jgi:hypothetical protein